MSSSGYEKFFQDARKTDGNVGRTSPSRHPVKRGTPQPGTRGAQRVEKRSSEGRSSASNRELTPEDKLRAALALKMRSGKGSGSRSSKRPGVRRKQEFPVFASICVVIAILTGGFGYFQPDLADELLSRIEIGAFSQASAADKAAPAGKAKPKAAAKENGKASAQKSASGPGDQVEGEIRGEKPSATEDGETAKSAALDANGKVAGVPDIKNWSEEELSFFKKLNERKLELDQREAELAKVEEELQKQKTDLEDKIKQLETMRTQISQTLKSRVANDQEKVSKLVEFYSTMKPQQASKIIETLNEDLAVEVLDKMKKKNAAEIMNMMDAKKARRLSELLTGYQRTPASADQASKEIEAE